MLGHGIAPNRSTESLHLQERLQHTVPATFRWVPWIGRGERSGGHTFQLRVEVAPGAWLMVDVAQFDGATGARPRRQAS